MSAANRARTSLVASASPPWAMQLCTAASVGRPATKRRVTIAPLLRLGEERDAPLKEAEDAERPHCSRSSASHRAFASAIALTSAADGRVTKKFIETSIGFEAEAMPPTTPDDRTPPAAASAANAPPQLCSASSPVSHWENITSSTVVLA